MSRFPTHLEHYFFVLLYCTRARPFHTSINYNVRIATQHINHVCLSVARYPPYAHKHRLSPYRATRPGRTGLRPSWRFSLLCHQLSSTASSLQRLVLVGNFYAFLLFFRSAPLNTDTPSSPRRRSGRAAGQSEYSRGNTRACLYRPL